MEQTSSAAYPNILVVDYVKKARVASPELLMKAETFLNVGYQKLLTFERPGGEYFSSGRPCIVSHEKNRSSPHIDSSQFQ